MKITTIGIDIGKRVFHLIGHDARGHECWRRKASRAQLLTRLAQVPACAVVMESCSGAQHWARQIMQLGHTVRLIAPQHTRAYVQGNKNDFNDAEAILEAHARPRTRSVPLKSLEQQDIQALHRVRQGFIKQRTALINQWRGLLAEYGVVIPKNVTAFYRQAPQVLADAGSNDVSARCRELLREQLQWLRRIDARIAELEIQLKRIEREDARACALSEELNGIGTLTATALVAAVGDGRAFRRGRDLSAWLGLVPGQHSSGGKPKLLGISKRGDTYLRTLFIHGARSVVYHAVGKHDPFSDWIQRLCARRGMNIAIVAVANKNARMVWAVLRKQALGQAA
ncbi:MAG: IS110 family transposase [Acidobacteria bacterium]|nr:IS110 family transposase [Acidobacteriota bacterium]